MSSVEVIALVIIKNNEHYHTIINGEMTTFITKNAIKEIIETFSKIIIDKSINGACLVDLDSDQIEITELKKYMLYCVKFQEGDGITFITSKKYKERVAFSFIFKLKDIFDKTQITSMFYESNDPTKIDTIEKINKDLQEIKIVLHKNIDSILERGEKIEHLILKSQALSESSKRFYYVAKKMNSCCTIA